MRLKTWYCVFQGFAEIGFSKKYLLAFEILINLLKFFKREGAVSAKIATSGSGVSWSFGVYSTGVSGAGNSGRYRAIVIYKNNTYSMTSITSS